MAAVSWIIYAIYFHVRAIGGWRGYRTTAIASLGFMSVLATFYFVNLWIVGLHPTPDSPAANVLENG